MISLYYHDNNASLAPHLLLREIGVDFKLEFVDRSGNAQKSSEFLALNPLGKIPVLVCGDTAIFESAAICMHLCELHPTANLSPAVGHPKRPIFMQWLMYLTNTLQADLMIYCYPQRYCGTVSDPATKFTTAGGDIELADFLEVAATNLKLCVEMRVTDMLIFLNEQLQGGTDGTDDADYYYLVDNNITACDYYLFMLLLWTENFARPPVTFLNLRRFMQNMSTRSAVKQTCEIEHIDITKYE